MIGIEIDPRDLDAMFEAMVKEIREHVTNDLFNRIRNNIVDMNLIGYSNQLFTETMPDYDNGVVNINSPAAGFVEFGTVGEMSVPLDPFAGKSLAGPVRGPGRRGPPPLPPMSRWVKAKGIAGKSQKLTEKMVDAADSIRWGIYWHGGKPHPFARNAIDLIRHKYDGAEIVLEVEVVAS